MFTSNRQSPTVIRLIGGLMMVVFIGWFALPSCHCQWDNLFGMSESQVEVPDGETRFNAVEEPALPCHCHNCPDQKFEPTNPAPQIANPRIAFSLKNDCPEQPFGSAFARHEPARGPPPGFLFITDPEPRTFLRQLSLRL